MPFKVEAVAPERPSFPLMLSLQARRAARLWQRPQEAWAKLALFLASPMLSSLRLWVAFSASRSSPD